MRIFLLVLFVLAIPFAAHAACTSPAGLASQTRYDSAANKMYYCNDANWIDMGGGAAGFSNPATSALNMNSNKITSLGTPTAAGDAANKTYVDGKFGAQANGNWCRSNGTQVICDQTAPSATDKVAKAGDTMTGALTLSGPPTANNHAATKKYIDDMAASLGSNRECRTTTAKYQGNLGGLSGADAKCASEFGAGWIFSRKVTPEAVAASFTGGMSWQPVSGMSNCINWSTNEPPGTTAYQGPVFRQAAAIVQAYNCNNTLSLTCCNF